MAWSNDQKQVAVRACRAAGISDEHRKLILRQFARALFDAQGRPTGEPSSTSKRLNNSDFEQFMATVERVAPGQKLLQFSMGYWQRKAQDDTQRMRHLALQISETLGNSITSWGPTALANWIRERVAGGQTDRLEDLDSEQLHALINGLRAFGHRHGVTLHA